MGLHGVSGCCQRPSRPTMSTVAVSVPYWGYTAAVCLLVDGMARLRLPTCPQHPPPSCSPTPHPPTHSPPTPHPPPINSICDITAVGKKLHPPPINSIRDITAVGKKLSQNPAVSARW